jgi:cyclic pyranopterin phosphate synthase
MRTCLFSQTAHDFTGLMSYGTSDEDLRIGMRGIIQRKEARHPIGEPVGGPGFLKPFRQHGSS